MASILSPAVSTVLGAEAVRFMVDMVQLGIAVSHFILYNDGANLYTIKIIGIEIKLLINALYKTCVKGASKVFVHITSLAL